MILVGVGRTVTITVVVEEIVEAAFWTMTAAVTEGFTVTVTVLR